MSRISAQGCGAAMLRPISMTKAIADQTADIDDNGGINSNIDKSLSVDIRVSTIDRPRWWNDVLLKDCAKAHNRKISMFQIKKIIL